MIRINDENSLGYSYYLDYDEDELYYYYDDDEDWTENDVIYYAEDYISDYLGGYGNSYSNYQNGYYYPNYIKSYSADYWDDYYDYDDYYDDYDDDDDDWDYDDDYYRNRDDELSKNGDTLRVGSNYNYDVWLKDYSRYDGIRVLDAEDNDKDLILAGNSHSNSIISGEGDTTLYGAGGSRNTLIGDNDSRNVYWYHGGSTDYAVNFITGDGGDSDIVRLSEANWSSILRDNTGIVFNMTDGNFMRLQLRNSNYDDPVLYTMDGTTISKMKITRNDTNDLTYRKDTNYYYFVQSGQLNVTGSDNTIWLGGEGGMNFVNVRAVDASRASGSNVLMGNTDSNIIYGGSGYTTLWGGSGSAGDSLFGGQGVDNFRVGRGEGNDTVYTDDANDVINLYNSTLSEITYATVEDYGAQIAFNTGEVFTLRNAAAVTPTFQLSDGSRYNFNRATKVWQNA